MGFLGVLFGQDPSKYEVLEEYLSLVGDDPDNAAHYYDKARKIYSSLGNNDESNRFRLISEKLQSEREF